MCEINSYKVTLALATFPNDKATASLKFHTPWRNFISSLTLAPCTTSRSLASVNDADLHGAVTDLAHRGNALHLEHLA
jgi:hypothetical protein